MNKLYIGGVVAGLVIGIGAYLIFSGSSQESPTQSPSTPQSENGWYTLEQSGLPFRAQFPREPKRTTQDLEIPNANFTVFQELYSVDDANGMSYFVILSTYPADLEANDQEGNLQTSLTGMVQSVAGNHLVDSRPGSVGNHKALDFTILNRGTKEEVKGKLVLGGPILYQVYTSYPAESFLDSGYRQFINSFEIK